MPVVLWRHFYHITHRDNLRNIFRYGILSWHCAHQRGLTASDISDPQVQERRNRIEPVFRRSIHEYAPLYFNPKNPMLFRRRELQEELVILEVSPDVLRYNQHIFTDGNAAAATTTFCTNREIIAASEDALRAEWWTALPDGKRRRCAEVLIFPSVTPRFITNAICANQGSASAINWTCPVSVIVDTSFFF